MSITTFLIGFGILVPALLHSQKVTVHTITDQRTTGDSYYNNRCEIDLRITGDEVRRYKFIRMAMLTKAMDDQGLDLLGEEDENEFEYEEIEQDGMVKVRVKNPSRKASVIKELSGEMNLYAPTEANGGIVKISNYQSKANTNLLPENAGIKMVYLTKESMDKYAKEQKQKQEAELNKLTGAAKEMAELLIGAVNVFSDIGNDPNQVTFVIDGDENKLVDLYFEDASGKKIKRNGYTKSGNMIGYYFDEQPKATWKLVMNIETPASVKKVPFTLKDIDLP